MKINTLNQEYSYEVNTFGEEEWSDIMAQFRDATLYQTRAYGKVRWGEDQLSHLVLKKNGHIVGAVQVRIVKVPVLGDFIAYIYMGPMWKSYGNEESAEVLMNMLRAIGHEYGQRRKLFVKIVPHEYCHPDNVIHDLYKNEGFLKDTSATRSWTFLVDITQPGDILKKGLDKNWKKNLPRALRGLLDLYEGTSMELYDTFIQLYKVMHERKKFISYVDIFEFKRLQEQLREDFKLNIFVCKYNGVPVSSLVWSSIGETGLPIFSATGNEGRTLRGAYFLRWTMLERLKEKNKRFLDQAGVNEIRNPGGYAFKKGMGGEKVEYIGEFDLCNDLFKKIILKSAFKIRKMIRDFKFYLYVKKSEKKTDQSSD